MEAKGEFVLSIATASPGVLVNAPAISQAHHTGRIYVKRIFQSHCRQSGRQNNEYGQDNQCLSLTPERIEKSRACLYTNRKDKQHQTEVS